VRVRPAPPSRGRAVHSTLGVTTMMRARTVLIRSGTPQDLIEAAGLGARIATRYCRAQGLSDDTIRRKVCSCFARILASDVHDDYECETLMAAVQRASAEVLAEPRESSE
jgi:hypothetical protein